MIFIVLPAYNEAENLPRLLNEIREIMDESMYRYSVVITDDGSSDNTFDVARQQAELMPVVLCKHEQNRGLAEALKTGLFRAVELAADRDIIVTMDADSTHAPGLVLRMVRMVREGYDVVIASRYRVGSRVIGVPIYRKFLSYGASIMFRVLFPFKGVKDYTCGYRAYRASVIKEMFSRYGDDFISESGFSCMVDILLKIRRFKYIAGEAPMILRYDQKEGESKMKVGKTIVQTLRLAFRRFLSVSNLLSSKRAKAVILVTLIFSIYTHSLFNQFSYDDGGLLLEVKALHGLSLDHLRLVFTSVPNKMEYLPIRDLTYMIDYSIWGDNAFGYHLSNVLLYVFLVLILYRLLSELFVLWGMENVWAPFLASVLFAVNPLHVEVVASISHRKDLVMGIFYLLSLFLFVRFRKQGGRSLYFASLVTAVLALLSKGTAVSLPAVVIFTDWILDVQKNSSIRRYIFRFLPFFVVTGIITALNLSLVRNAGFLPPPLFGGMTERLSLSAISIFSYLKMLVWPYPLSIWHTVEFFNSVSNVRTLGAFAGLLVLMAVIVLMRRKYPHVSFSISWYLITLAPVLLVASSNYLLFERYVLLPSIGFCIFLSIVLLRMFENKLKLLKIISAIGGTSIITAYIIITVVQIPVWKNNITLWDHAFTYNPYDTEIYTKLAKQFFIKNRYDEAFRILERARKINPVLPDADFYYALYDYQQGDFEAALTRLNGIQQRFGMDYVDVYCLYGQIYRQQGETEKAIKAFERALSSELTLFSPYCPKGDVSRELKTLIK